MKYKDLINLNNYVVEASVNFLNVENDFDNLIVHVLSCTWRMMSVQGSMRV